MSFDSERADFMRDYDRQKQQQAAANRAAKTTAKPTAKPAATGPSAASQAEIKRLRGKNDDLEAKLGRIRDIAVEMSKRSARMSNVPGYVLKGYADDLIKKLNGK